MKKQTKFFIRNNEAGTAKVIRPYEDRMVKLSVAHGQTVEVDGWDRLLAPDFVVDPSAWCKQFGVELVDGAKTAEPIAAKPQQSSEPAPVLEFDPADGDVAEDTGDASPAESAPTVSKRGRKPRIA